MKVAIALFAALVVCGCSDQPGYKADIDKSTKVDRYNDSDNGVVCYRTTAAYGVSISCLKVK